jgi:hypothetical protein
MILDSRPDARDAQVAVSARALAPLRLRFYQDK